MTLSPNHTADDGEANGAGNVPVTARSGFEDYDAITRSKITLLNKSRFIEWCATQKILNATDLKVCILLAQYYNTGRGVAWPSQKTLSERTGISRSSICDALDKLAILDIILRISGGIGYSNRYVPNFLKAEGNQSELNPVSGHTDTSCSEGRSATAQPGGHTMSGDPDTKPLRPPVANSETGESKGVHINAGNGANTNQMSAPGFDTFWQAYPKKKNYDKAREAYQRALSRGSTPDELLGKAVHYAQATATWSDSKFVMYAENWLDKNKYKEEFRTFDRDANINGVRETEKSKQKKSRGRPRKKPAKSATSKRGKTRQPPSGAAKANNGNTGVKANQGRTSCSEPLDMADHKEHGPVCIVDRTGVVIRYSKYSSGKSFVDHKSKFSNFRTEP